MEGHSKVMDSRHTANHLHHPATVNSCSPAMVKRLLNKVMDRRRLSKGMGRRRLSKGMGSHRLSKDMGRRRRNRVTGLPRPILPIPSKIMDSSTASRAMASNHLLKSGMAVPHLLHHKEATTHNREDTDSHHHPHHAVTKPLISESGVEVLTTGSLILHASLSSVQCTGMQAGVA